MSFSNLNKLYNFYSCRIKSCGYVLRPSTAVILSTLPFCQGNLWNFTSKTDSLRVRRSGILTPVCARVSAPVPTDSGVHPASCIMGNVSVYQAYSDRVVALASHPHLAPGLKRGQDDTSAPSLGLCGMSQSEIYLFYNFLKYDLENCYKA